MAEVVELGGRTYAVRYRGHDTDVVMIDGTEEREVSSIVREAVLAALADKRRPRREAWAKADAARLDAMLQRQTTGPDFGSLDRKAQLHEVLRRGVQDGWAAEDGGRFTVEKTQREVAALVPKLGHLAEPGRSLRDLISDAGVHIEWTRRRG